MSADLRGAKDFYSQAGLIPRPSGRGSLTNQQQNDIFKLPGVSIKLRPG